MTVVDFKSKQHTFTTDAFCPACKTVDKYEFIRRSKGVLPHCRSCECPTVFPMLTKKTDGGNMIIATCPHCDSHDKFLVFYSANHSYPSVGCGECECISFI